MPEDKNKQKIITDQSKLYFVYFLIFSLIVIGIFAYFIISNYWNYFSILRGIENYYQTLGELKTKAYPSTYKFDPVIGYPNAPLVIYEYADIFCPTCKQTHEDLKSLQKIYGNKIQVVFKGLPITVYPETRHSLLAAYCASEQNQFQPYLDLLYSEPDRLNQQKYLEYANQLGIEQSVFSSCLDSQKYLSVLNQNLADSLKLEITSLPTLYFNKEKIEGYFDINRLKMIAEQNL